MENTRKPYSDNLCLFRALALHLHGKERLGEETSKMFSVFIEKTSGTDPANFRSVCLEDIAAVEDFVQAEISLYDLDIAVESMIVELARSSAGKQSTTLQPLHYISHV